MRYPQIQQLHEILSVPLTARSSYPIIKCLNIRTFFTQHSLVEPSGQQYAYIPFNYSTIAIGRFGQAFLLLRCLQLQDPHFITPNC